MLNFLIAVTVAELAVGVTGLDNGLALTPPMGWLAWQRYRCITDCETYPDECVRYLYVNIVNILLCIPYTTIVTTIKFVKYFIFLLYYLIIVCIATLTK